MVTYMTEDDRQRYRVLLDVIADQLHVTQELLVRNAILRAKSAELLAERARAASPAL